MSSTTNVLALPLAHLTIAVGNNEDWIDCIEYLVNTTGSPQLDLRGIDFDMEIRRLPDENEVILTASTATGTLFVGTPPNYGYLIFYVPESTMKYLRAGQYVGDVTASADGFERVCLTIDFTIIEGITR
jgi:hypothetical protein